MVPSTSNILLLTYDLLSVLKLYPIRVWWCISVIPALWRWMQEDGKFKASLTT
jgi:hypothetical protein